MNKVGYASSQYLTGAITTISRKIKQCWRLLMP